MLTFPFNSTTCGPFRRPQLVSPRRAPKIVYLLLASNLNKLFFFQIPQILSASGHDVIHVPGNISYLGFLLRDLWLSHPPHTRVNTCAQCVHLTNQCNKRKVLCLTKPKGKIYKTKSLWNYISLSILFTVYSSFRGCPGGVMVKAMDCGIIVSEFVLQLRY